MKNIACHISKQRMLQPSSHHISVTLAVSPEGTEDRNRLPAIKSAASAATPQRCALRELGMRSHRTPAPGGWGAHQRNDFSEPRLLHLPIHRKALNSLTWSIWLPLVNNNLLMFRLPGLCCKNSYIPWLPPCLFGAVPQSYLRCCDLGLSPPFCLNF